MTLSPVRPTVTFMNRRTFDAAVPGIYAILVVLMYFTVSGKTATIVTVVGAMLVGLYYTAFRRNLPPGR
jgi:hypothetical protein